jgi:hypothetical protein
MPIEQNLEVAYFPGSFHLLFSLLICIIIKSRTKITSRMWHHEVV